MSFNRYDWLNLLILLVQIHSIRSNLVLTDFNVTLTTPNKISSTVESAYVNKRDFAKHRFFSFFLSIRNQFT